jgi:hypothetical protein
MSVVIFLSSAILPLPVFCRRQCRHRLRMAATLDYHNLQITADNRNTRALTAGMYTAVTGP